MSAAQIIHRLRNCPVDYVSIVHRAISENKNGYSNVGVFISHSGQKKILKKKLKGN